MKTFGIVSAVIFTLIVGAVVVLWFVYQSNYPSYTHRYRLTIEAEVDGQLKSGSGVVQVTWEKQPQIGEAPPWISRVKGQAVFVDLDAYGALLALPSGGEGASGLYSDNSTGPAFLGLLAFADTLGIASGYLTTEALVALSRLRAQTELQANNMPRLAILLNKADPRSAHLVRQSQLQALNGPAVRFRRALIEITDDPITTDLATKLPWLKAMAAAPRGRLSGDRQGTLELKAETLSPRIDP